MRRRGLPRYAFFGLCGVGSLSAAALYFHLFGLQLCPSLPGIGTGTGTETELSGLVPLQPEPLSPSPPQPQPQSTAPCPQAAPQLPSPAPAPRSAVNLPESMVDAAVGSAPPAGSYSRVGLGAVADRGAQGRFGVSLASQRCYAQQHGYEYHVLDPSEYPMCKQRDFFFRKHCTVARFLERQPPGYLLFVLDGDNPAVVLNRNLDVWLAEAQAVDVLLYERWMNNEIMAGNYVVRNSEWGIAFCDGWASYDGVDQPKGYHSSDNGAIHLHVLRSLRISNWGHCAHLWDRLSASVMDLDPYYAFVACTRLMMGAPRRWKLDGKYRLTILPRGHAWSIDGVVANSRTSSVGPVTHHGQKTSTNYLQYFTPEFVQGPQRSCASMLRKDITVDPTTYMGWLGRSLEERIAGSLQAWTRQAAPPWDVAYLRCMRTLSCRPLDDPMDLPVNLPRPGQKELAFIRIPAGARFEQCAKEHETCSCVGIARFGLLQERKLSAPMRLGAAPGSVRCNAEAFAGHDPAPGAGKFCYCAAGA